MKSARHFAIREIINSELVSTQEELGHALAARGLNVTQATISRDIKELQLIKIADEHGYHYALPETARVGGLREKMKRLFQESVLNIQDSENLIVIKTIPGAAQAVASMVDAAEWRNILGTVAGDDTIFIAVKPKNMVPKLLEELVRLMR